MLEQSSRNPRRVTLTTCKLRKEAEDFASRAKVHGWRNVTVAGRQGVWKVRADVDNRRLQSEGK